MLKTIPVLLALLLLQMAGCASLVTGGLTQAGYQSSPQDRATTSRVEKALRSNTRLNTSRVRINTYKGTVTLNGRVNSRQSEKQAIAIVRTIKGVKRVISRLMISSN